MTSAQLLALIIQHGLPAAIQIAEILKQPERELTSEDWSKLKNINARPFSYYEAKKPNSGE